MSINRRQFLVGAAGALVVPSLAGPASRSTKVVAFDAFPIFDPRPVFTRVEETFPGRGAELSALWRTRQFEYTWLRTAARDYADFWRVTQEALVYAAEALKLNLSAGDQDHLMSAYLELKPWPDVHATLEGLKAAGVKIAFLSNFTTKMLTTNLEACGLSSMFDAILSTDRVREYKPSPKAYQMALDQFRVRKSEVAFVAFAPWDAYGAARFGYRTYWANRSKAAPERLGAQPVEMGLDLSGLIQFATR
jgi:2-haloacid dehalogenase